MANFQSLQMTFPRYPVSGPGIGGRSLKVERAVVDLSTLGAIASGDTVELFKLHPKFRVIGGFVKTETAAGTGVTYTVGDRGGGGATADPARFFASASASAAGVNSTIAPTGVDFLASPNTLGGRGQYTTVVMTVGGAATNNTGRIVVVLYGFVEEPQ